MAIVSSGPLSFSQIQAEFGGQNPISFNEYYRGKSYVRATEDNSFTATARNTSVDTSFGSRPGYDLGPSWNTTERLYTHYRWSDGGDQSATITMTLAEGQYSARIGGFLQRAGQYFDIVIKVAGVTVYDRRKYYATYGQNTIDYKIDVPAGGAIVEIYNYQSALGNTWQANAIYVGGDTINTRTVTDIDVVNREVPSDGAIAVSNFYGATSLLTRREVLDGLWLAQQSTIRSSTSNAYELDAIWNQTPQFRWHGQRNDTGAADVTHNVDQTYINDSYDHSAHVTHIVWTFGQDVNGGRILNNRLLLGSDSTYTEITDTNEISTLTVSNGFNNVRWGTYPTSLQNVKAMQYYRDGIRNDQACVYTQMILPNRWTVERLGEYAPQALGIPGVTLTLAPGEILFVGAMQPGFDAYNPANDTESYATASSNLTKIARLQEKWYENFSAGIWINRSSTNGTVTIAESGTHVNIYKVKSIDP